MTDDLVNQLRNSKGWPTLGNAAADRIEELEAEKKRLRDALRPCVKMLASHVAKSGRSVEWEDFLQHLAAIAEARAALGELKGSKQ